MADSSSWLVDQAVARSLGPMYEMLSKELEKLNDLYLFNGVVPFGVSPEPAPHSYYKGLPVYVSPDGVFSVTAKGEVFSAPRLKDLRVSLDYVLKPKPFSAAVVQVYEPGIARQVTVSAVEGGVLKDAMGGMVFTKGLYEFNVGDAKAVDDWRRDRNALNARWAALVASLEPVTIESAKSKLAGG